MHGVAVRPRKIRSSRGMLSNENVQSMWKCETAHKWWNDHLKRSNWILFTPKSIHIEYFGCIPVQYVVGDEKSKATVERVLEHGTRGIHYAIGFLDLYNMVRSFGTTTPDIYGVRPGDLKHEIILSYHGPSLPNINQEPTTTSTTERQNSQQETTGPSSSRTRERALDQSQASMPSKKRKVTVSAENSSEATARVQERVQRTEEEQLKKQKAKWIRWQMEEQLNQACLTGFWKSRLGS